MLWRLKGTSSVATTSLDAPCIQGFEWTWTALPMTRPEGSLYTFILCPLPLSPTRKSWRMFAKPQLK